MSFLKSDDYRVVIGDRAFDIIQQSEQANREKAEAMAIEEMSGYLRPKYDVTQIFSKQGDERNHLIVMYLCDIALYHLVSWLPQKLGYEIREIRYKRAVEWLEEVQKGHIVPDLPTTETEDGQSGGGDGVSWNSEKKLIHGY